MYTVSTAAVNIAGHVTLDPVGDADVNKGEKPPMHKEG